MSRGTNRLEFMYKAKNAMTLPTYYVKPFSGAWSVACEGRALVKGFTTPDAAYKWIRLNTSLPGPLNAYRQGNRQGPQRVTGGGTGDYLEHNVQLTNSPPMAGCGQRSSRFNQISWRLPDWRGYR
jgi:hypothetical protein